MSDTLRFPDGFLFGASISAYQTEGGNTNTDWWWWEHIEATPTREPSGDACDVYHRHGAQPAVDYLVEARRLGAAAVRARAGIPTGVTLALPDIQYEDGPEPGTSSLELESRVNDWFFELARHDDFIGVQPYTRFRYGPEGSRSPGHDWSDTMRELEETDHTTQMGYEYYPQALGGAIRRAHRSCPGVPILVTENGIATVNDEKRTAYINTALREVLACLAEGIDVRSYLYWSLLDNFEWAFGYAPTFGLVGVDRQTLARHPRPSASWLGAVARAGALSGAVQSV